jgi:hypothetical protein
MIRKLALGMAAAIASCLNKRRRQCTGLFEEHHLRHRQDLYYGLRCSPQRTQCLARHRDPPARRPLCLD